MRTTAKHIYVDPVELRVRVDREVTLGQDEYSSRPVGFKLVKSSIYYRKPALFSDSIHNVFKVARPRHPHAVDVPDEMFH